MKIHPTAIIDPKAELHDSVEVGPFCIIEKDVVVGEGCILDSTVRLHSGTILGKNNRVFHGASLGGLPQDLSFNPSTKTYIKIGDNNLIREGCIFHRATVENGATTIGNDNYLMGNVHLAHDTQLGNGIIIIQNSIIAGHVHIDDYAFISGLVPIHQFVHVGAYTMVAGCAKIVKDIPPYSMVDGNPARVIGLNSVGLKRKGFSADARNAIKRVYKVFYHSGLNTKQALAELRKNNDHPPEVEHVIEFFEKSKRGVTDHRPIGSGNSEE